jgi:peptide chain release factor subunit 3
LARQVLVEVGGIYSEADEEATHAFGGDNVRIRLRGIEDEDVSPGFMLTSPAKPVHAVRRFEAQLAILDHKNIICAGYSAVMHVHTLAEEVQLTVCSSPSSNSVHQPDFVFTGPTSLFRQEDW